MCILSFYIPLKPISSKGINIMYENKWFFYVLIHPLLREGFSVYREVVNHDVWRTIFIVACVDIASNILGCFWRLVWMVPNVEDDLSSVAGVGSRVWRKCLLISEHIKIVFCLKIE